VQGVFLALKSTSTIFLALSQAPPALAMKMAWNRPKESYGDEVSDKEVRIEESQGQGRQK
jgi:hypothetical protein